MNTNAKVEADNNNNIQFTITRDGYPPLRFKGVELTSVTSRDHNSTRWTVLSLYKTLGGKYIVERNRLTCWQSEKDFDEAGSFNSAEEVIDWLRGEERIIGRLSQELIEKAVKIEPDFAKSWVEEVD
jgi:EXLDI family protein